MIKQGRRKRSRDDRHVAFREDIKQRWCSGVYIYHPIRRRIPELCTVSTECMYNGHGESRFRIKVDSAVW